MEQDAYKMVENKGLCQHEYHDRTSARSKKDNQVVWFFSLTNNFWFTPTLGGGLSGNVDPAQWVSGVKWNTVYSVDLNIYKILLKNKLAIKLDACVMGNGRVVTTDKPAYYSRRERTNRNQTFTLTVQYSFGGKKTVKQRNTANSIQQYEKIENNY